MATGSPHYWPQLPWKQKWKGERKQPHRSVNQTNAVILVSTEFSSLAFATTMSAGNCINLSKRQLQAYKTLGINVQWEHT